MRGRIGCSFLPHWCGSKPICRNPHVQKELLANDKPTCQLERIAVDLADTRERRRFFEAISNRGKRGLVLTEGLLIYLSAEEVAQFAEDLSGVASLQRWILDMHSPRLLAMMQRNTGKALEKVGAPSNRAASEGPIYRPGTIEIEVLSAARFDGAPLFRGLCRCCAASWPASAASAYPESSVEEKPRRKDLPRIAQLPRGEVDQQSFGEPSPRLPRFEIASKKRRRSRVSARSTAIRSSWQVGLSFASSSFCT